MSERIYVIEDDENIQEIIKLSLESSGYSITLFNNAIDAIVAIHKIRLILQYLMSCYQN